jgi:hypothetical protein
MLLELAPTPTLMAANKPTQTNCYLSLISLLVFLLSGGQVLALPILASRGADGGATLKKNSQKVWSFFSLFVPWDVFHKHV